MLDLKAIDTFRGPAHILHGVSLAVGKQEVVCLVGRNGAGKTTTIESIMGFLPVKAGQIEFNGENLSTCLHTSGPSVASDIRRRTAASFPSFRWART